MGHERHMLVSVAALLAAAVISSPASAECTCRAPGVTALHGQTVCLRTPGGLRLARCEEVLNNSSWTFLAEPCPEASLLAENRLAALSQAPAVQPDIR